MGTSRNYDAVIVGSGPNGLSAAVTLAEHGHSVLVLERHEEVGGGTRTQALTLPGFVHDVCSAIHPLGIGSPFFRRRTRLADFGLAWKHCPIAVAHPLDNGVAAALVSPPASFFETAEQLEDSQLRSTATERYAASVRETADGLGLDGAAYMRLFLSFERDPMGLLDALLGPILPPKRPLKMARFGPLAMRSANGFARARFRGPKARALFSGCAAHSILDLDSMGTAAFGLVLMLGGHLFGWPCAEGGSARITGALAAYLESLGGEIRLGTEVRSLGELPASRAVLFDTTPEALADIAGDALPGTFAHDLRRFEYGPGTFKIDWALSEPIPWTAPECRRAGTVHVGGTWEEVAESERLMMRGELSERPFVLVAQQSLFDRRSPPGQHTGWAYCHVPHGCDVDRTEAIESQVERFAPGFRDIILHRHTMGSSDFEAYNPNLIGGDIGGGKNTLNQLVARPTLALDPYSTPNPRLYLCSASTPPGGGVHGMCGHLAALSALRQLRKS